MNLKNNNFYNKMSKTKALNTSGRGGKEENDPRKREKEKKKTILVHDSMQIPFILIQYMLSIWRELARN